MINLVIAEGNLLEDPIIDDTKRCYFQIKSRNGAIFDIDCYKTLAENCAKYLKKDSHVLVSGIFKTLNTGKCVEARDVKFLPKAG